MRIAKLLGAAVALWLVSCEGTQRESAFTETGRASPAPDAGAAVGQSQAPAGPTTSPVRPTEQSDPRIGLGPDVTMATAAPVDAGTACEPGSDEGCPFPCAGCSILDVCVGPGVTNPDNQCQVCDPLRSVAEWSSKDGVICDDDQFCTVDEVCSDGQCVGIARQCDDGVACNGVARCDEDANSCVAGTPQCPGNSACDTATAQCVSTCTGCIIAGSCIGNGAEEPGNPCRVCNAAISQTTYTAVVGKACGAGPGECSFQDTCDANGICQPNPTPVGSPCGSNSSSQCDAPDTCNAQGQCTPNNLARGTRCGALPASCARPDQCDGAGSCQSRAAERLETCNGMEDDCDVVTDEGFNLNADANNCGACGRTCQAGNQCTNGACSPPLRVAGAQCTTGGQCQSGVCTGGFCCAGACSGVCAICQQGTGACIAPADDPNCPSVACNGGPCKVPQSISSERCRALNQCKTSADCPTLRNVDDRTACGPAGSHQRCINGTCGLPTVLCGGVNQQITETNVCCEALGDAAGLRETFTTRVSCPPTYLDGGGFTTTPITCDDNRDCPTGESCCLRSVFEGAIECTPQAECVLFQTESYTVCSSPQGIVASCQQGGCTPFFLGGFVTGWGFCQ